MSETAIASSSSAATAAAENAFVNDFAQAMTDSRISYPCYKSFDEFIDTERLRALDSFLTERIARHLAADRGEYFLNLHRLDAQTPYQPGVREIWLTRPAPEAPAGEADRIDESELWYATAEMEEFAPLADFIRTLPFKTTGRMLIIYDGAGKAVPPHRDHLNSEACHEFLWFRTNLKKPFYVLNPETGEKLYIASYSAWFDAVNQYHGSDALPGGELSFSIRVDGKFTDEFKSRIPQPEFNLASTPALWACLTDERRAKRQNSPTEEAAEN